MDKKQGRIQDLRQTYVLLIRSLFIIKEGTHPCLIYFTTDEGLYSLVFFPGKHIHIMN